MMLTGLSVSKARGLCPLDPRQRLSLWNPLIRVMGGRGNALPQAVGVISWSGGRITPPSHNPALMGSKGSALSGVQGQSPWPYLLTGRST